MIHVAVIGNHRHTFCTEVHLARAFAENGCTVHPMQVDEVATNPDDAMDFLKGCDLAAYTRTHSPGMFLDRSWSDRWREIERGGTRTVGIHLDRYFDLERESLVHDGDAQFTVGTFFSADGGNDDRFAKAGVSHAWLPPAVDRTEAEMPGRFNRRMAHDVVFVGSGNYHAEYPERDELLNWLKLRYGSRFAHYGHGGGRPVVRGQALNDLYASARVVVGDSCFGNAADWPRLADRYISDRVPETIGRGGFLVHPWNATLATWLLQTHEPGNFENLGFVIERVLDDPGDFDALRVAGRGYVLANHTYTHRMRGLLCTVGLCEQTEEEAA